MANPHRFGDSLIPSQPFSQPNNTDGLCSMIYSFFGCSTKPWLATVLKAEQTFSGWCVKKNTCDFRYWKMGKKNTRNIKYHQIVGGHFFAVAKKIAGLTFPSFSVCHQGVKYDHWKLQLPPSEKFPQGVVTSDFVAGSVDREQFFLMVAGLHSRGAYTVPISLHIRACIFFFRTFHSAFFFGRKKSFKLGNCPVWHGKRSNFQSNWTLRNVTPHLTCFTTSFTTSYQTCLNYHSSIPPSQKTHTVDGSEILTKKALGTVVFSYSTRVVCVCPSKISPKNPSTSIVIQKTATNFQLKLTITNNPTIFVPTKPVPRSTWSRWCSSSNLALQKPKRGDPHGHTFVLSHFHQLGKLLQFVLLWAKVMDMEMTRLSWCNQPTNQPTQRYQWSKVILVRKKN